MIDERSGMGAIGDMSAYMQFKAARSMEDAAKQPGGAAGQGMGLGLGIGYGQMMAGAMHGGGGGQQGQQQGGQTPPQQGQTAGGAAAVGGAAAGAGAAGAAATTNAEITINSEPDGAEIYVDDAFESSTPSKLSVSAGPHVLKVTRPGYKDWERRINTPAGSAKTFNAILEKNEG